MHTAPWLIAIKIFSFSFLLGSYIFLKMDLRSPVSLPSCSLPFLSGSWPLIITLNLILSVSPMTIQFPKANEWSVCILVLFYLPESFGTILFSLVCFFQLTFKTEYFLGFFPCKFVGSTNEIRKRKFMELLGKDPRSCNAMKSSTFLLMSFYQTFWIQ